MYDGFLKEVKKIASVGRAEAEKRAYESIVGDLLVRKLRGKEKARGLDEYDGESLFGKTTLYPGQVYAFRYDAASPTVYDDGRTRFEYYDSLPVALVTHVAEGRVRGVNLNLCSYPLRAFVLNALHALDPEFYESGAAGMVARGAAPISNKVASAFLNPESEKAFVGYVVRTCSLRNQSLLYRTYLSDRIGYCRMLEPWQHRLVPFLNYYGSLKKDVLEAIYKATGMDRLRI